MSERKSNLEANHSELFSWVESWFHGICHFVELFYLPRFYLETDKDNRTFFQLNWLCSSFFLSFFLICTNAQSKVTFIAYCATLGPGDGLDSIKESNDEQKSNESYSKNCTKAEKSVSNIHIMLHVNALIPVPRAIPYSKNLYTC